MRASYFEVGRRRVSERGKLDRRIEVEKCEVGVCEGISDVGIPNHSLSIGTSRTPRQAIFHQPKDSRGTLNWLTIMPKDVSLLEGRC